MGTLIDASVLVAAERGTLDLDGVLAARGDEQIALSAITAAEILHGVHRSAGRRACGGGLVERLLEQLPVVSFDLVAARIHARLWAELAAKGSVVRERDLLIAATAMARGHSVATRDERSFPRIPGLSVVRW
jgi:predicted nucleic acid-binding protein